MKNKVSHGLDNDGNDLMENTSSILFKLSTMHLMAS